MSDLPAPLWVSHSVGPVVKTEDGTFMVVTGYQDDQGHHQIARFAIGIHAARHIVTFCQAFLDQHDIVESGENE